MSATIAPMFGVRDDATTLDGEASAGPSFDRPRFANRIAKPS
jgi:hypothetical protein